MNYEKRIRPIQLKRAKNLFDSRKKVVLQYGTLENERFGYIKLGVSFAASSKIDDLAIQINLKNSSFYNEHIKCSLKLNEEETLMCISTNHINRFTDIASADKSIELFDLNAAAKENLKNVFNENPSYKASSFLEEIVENNPKSLINTATDFSGTQFLRKRVSNALKFKNGKVLWALNYFSYFEKEPFVERNLILRVIQDRKFKEFIHKHCIMPLVVTTYRQGPNDIISDIIFIVDKEAISIDTLDQFKNLYKEKLDKYFTMFIDYLNNIIKGEQAETRGSLFFWITGKNNQIKDNLSFYYFTEQIMEKADFVATINVYPKYNLNTDKGAVFVGFKSDKKLSIIKENSEEKYQKITEPLMELNKVLLKESSRQALEHNYFSNVPSFEERMSDETKAKIKEIEKELQKLF